jgi:endonuclease/exonuclease/phosphatase family metal-dependent hydrolase
MATLSPWPLSKARIIRFRDQSSFWKPHWYVPNLATFQRRAGGRIALVAEANIYGRKVVTYNLHLESRGADELRVRQLNEVLADCRKNVARPSFVVAGDFNLDARGGDAARVLGDAGFRNALGSPGGPTTTQHGLSHARTIDWIFVSDTTDFQSQVHRDIHASDHFPVSATFVQPNAAA